MPAALAPPALRGAQGEEPAKQNAGGLQDGVQGPRHGVLPGGLAVLARLLRDDVAANLTRDLPSAGTVLMTISRCPSRISGFRWATAGRSAPRMFERLFGRNRDAPRDPACLRRACRFKLVSRTHACGRSLTRVQGQRVRAPPTASNPRRSTRIAAHNAPATGAMITAVPTLFMTGLDRRQYSPKALFILMRKSFRGK